MVLLIIVIYCRKWFSLPLTPYFWEGLVCMWDQMPLPWVHTDAGLALTVG